ncbi:MAG TPA: branched-chain amino acid ABC transporter substrate-binding protein [Candidatus Elarobacter sp.]|jgi:branched-chain amino acid transport system substrate-binding protein
MNRAGFLGAAGSTLAAATQPTLPAFTPTLRIAVVCPQSGVDAQIGRQLIGGVHAAVDYINNNRSSFDRALLYEFYDDRNTAADAVVQASFATGNPDTWATIGHLSAAATLAALPTYNSAQMPLIVPTVTDDRVTNQGYRNVFRLPTKDSDEGGLLAQYAIAGGAKAPHVMTMDADYGPVVADGFVRRASAMKVVVAETKISAAKPDFNSAVADAIVHVPDCIAFAGNVDEMGPLLPLLRERGYTGRFIASQGFFDGTTVAKYPKESDGMVVSSAVPYYPLAPTAQNDLSDYTARYGPITPVAAYGYAAVQLIYLAQRRSGATSRPLITRAISTGGAFDTVTGSYTFGANGDPFDPNCYFYAIKGGKFVYERQAHRSGFMMR